MCAWQLRNSISNYLSTDGIYSISATPHSAWLYLGHQNAMKAGIAGFLWRAAEDTPGRFCAFSEAGETQIDMI